MDWLVAPNVAHDRLTIAIGAVLRAARTNGASPDGRAVAIRALPPVPRGSHRRAALAVDLSAYLCRAATRVAMRMDIVSELLSSVSAVAVEPRLARGLGALVIGIVQTMAELADDVPLRIYFGSEWDGERLMMAFASRELISSPVLSAPSARSFTRAVDLSQALDGELVRGIKDGMMVFGAAFRWRPLDTAASSHFGR